jgi:hypothetical protein
MIIQMPEDRNWHNFWNVEHTKYTPKPMDSSEYIGLGLSGRWRRKRPSLVLSRRVVRRLPDVSGDCKRHLQLVLLGLFFGGEDSSRNESLHAVKAHRVVRRRGSHIF